MIDGLFVSGDLLEWNIAVHNVGEADAGATRTALTQGATTTLLDTPPLAAGASATVKLTCPYGSLGDATAQADAQNAVDESNEDNNGASATGQGTGGRCRYP